MNDAIPQPKKLPLVGNLFDLDLQKPVQSLMQLAKTYGPIFRLIVPTEDLIVVSSQELAHELCDESRFDKKVHGPLEVVRDFAGDGLITAYTDEANWQRAHRILAPAFGPAFLRSMFEPMQDLAEQLILKWERQDPATLINISDDMTRLTVDTITLCAFGHRLNSFYDRSLHPFVGAMFRGLTEASARVRRVPFLTNLLFTKQAQYRADIKTMRELAAALITERKRLSPEARPKDVLSLMLSAEDAESGEKLSDENIKNQIVTFLIAGHETTSGLLSFAIHELLKQPELLRRAVEHVDAVVGTSKIAFEHLSNLVFIDQILKETLRLWPTAPAFAFRSKADRTLLAERYAVDRAQTILLLLPSLHRDAKIWDRPEIFDPDRMVQARFDDLPPDAWKPFGNGQRSCIGRSFAMQEATLALAMILQRFELRHVASEFKLEVKESLTLKPANLVVRAILRNRDACKLASFTKESGKQISAKPRGDLRIFYGSHGGTAASFARELFNESDDRGFNAEIGPLDLASEGAIAPGVFVAICASYDGRAPANAAGFVKSLARRDGGSFQKIQFAVFGCGNRDWARTYQAIPKFLDSKFKELGGERLLERGEADGRGNALRDFQEWKVEFWKAMEQKERTTIGSSEFDYEILPAAKETRLDAAAGFSSEGTKLAAHFGVSAYATLAVRGLPNNPSAVIHRNATEFFDSLPLFAKATNKQLSRLAELTTCPPHKHHLLKLTQSGSSEQTAFELLKLAPSCTISLKDFIRLIIDAEVGESSSRKN